MMKLTKKSKCKTEGIFQSSQTEVYADIIDFRYHWKRVQNQEDLGSFHHTYTRFVLTFQLVTEYCYT